MIEAVLDASAVLAYLRDEPGAAAVELRLATAVISSINLAEVVTKLVQRGASSALAREIVGSLRCEVFAVDAEHGFDAGLMHARTRALGLSLGDCVCLSLAAREGVPAITADRAWVALGLPVEVSVVR